MSGRGVQLYLEDEQIEWLGNVNRSQVVQKCIDRIRLGFPTVYLEKAPTPDVSRVVLEKGFVWCVGCMDVVGRVDMAVGASEGLQERCERFGVPCYASVDDLPVMEAV